MEKQFLDVSLLDVDFNSIVESKKLKISPVGDIVGYDGRVFRVDGETVVKAMNDFHNDIFLNVDHGFDMKHGSAACGWFSNYSFDENGIYAQLDLNEVGKELTSKKLYRYLSPEFRIEYQNELRVVTQIVGVGLVNRPNLETDGFNKAQKPKEKEDTEMAKTVEELQKENDNLVAKNSDLQSQVDTLEKEGKELQVENALALNKILPAQVEFCKSLDKAAFASFVDMNKTSVDHLKQKTPISDEEQNSTKSDAETEINKQLGLEA